jgi:hypothetical protein
MRAKIIERPQIETELGDLKKPGTRVWSYTGIVYEVTLGWQMRKYGKNRQVALLRSDGTVRWLPTSVIKKIQQWRKSLCVHRCDKRRCSHHEWMSHFRWQITP